MKAAMHSVYGDVGETHSRRAIRSDIARMYGDLRYWQVVTAFWPR
jgi:hypothetical protein